MKHIIRYFVCLLALFMAGNSMAQQERLQPYFLASVETGAVEENVESVRQALSQNGFEIIGEYQPYDGAHILVVTNDELKQNAGGSEFGGYGSVQRIALTQIGEQVQLAYTNPVYMANAYRMNDDLSDVATKLTNALGNQQPFGSKKGLPAKRLRKYRYMVMMPRFDNPVVLAEYASHDEAVNAVEQGLSEGRGGTAKIYRVDIPGKDEVLFGVAIQEGKGADEHVMSVVDFKDLKQTPHLPYELLVSGNKVYALHGKFRIALSFPDLSMGTFMKISKAPKGIENALRQAAGGEK